MFNFQHTFYSFSVDNLEKADRFYSKIIGVKTERNPMGLRLILNEGSAAFVYEKADHQPATFTILNFSVNNLDEAVDQLKSNGIELEYYEGLTDETRVRRGLRQNEGPDIAWFKDPAGNVLSVIQEK